MDITGLGSLAEFATTVVDKFFPDADAKRKDEAAKELLAMTQEFNLISAQRCSSVIYYTGAIYEIYR